MNKNKISSLVEYMQIIEEINKQKFAPYQYDMNIFFRGQSSTEYELLPSIARKIENSNKTYLDVEYELISQAKYYYPEVFKSSYNNLDLLAKMQHYGIYTRLMDITINPLVALYFSCSSNIKDKDTNKYIDGEVFVFKLKKNSLEPKDIEAIVNIKQYSKCSIMSMETFFLNNGLDVSFIDNDNEQDYCYKFPYYRFRDYCKTPIYIQQSELALRQKIQGGRYLLFSNELKNGKYCDDDLSGNIKKGYYFSNNIKKIEKYDNEIIHEIITINGQHKERILEELNRIGINEAMLFPEDIDKGCKYIVNNIFKN